MRQVYRLLGAWSAEFAELALAIIAKPIINREVIRIHGPIRMAPR